MHTPNFNIEDGFRVQMEFDTTNLTRSFYQRNQSNILGKFMHVSGDVVIVAVITLFAIYVNYIKSDKS